MVSFPDKSTPLFQCVCANDSIENKAINDGTLPVHSLKDKLSRFSLYLHREDMWMDQKDVDGKTRKLVLSLAALSRMRMRKLQCNLARNIIHMQFQNEEPEEDWEDSLSKYGMPLYQHARYIYSQSLTNHTL